MKLKGLKEMENRNKNNENYQTVMELLNTKYDLLIQKNDIKMKILADASMNITTEDFFYKHYLIAKERYLLLIKKSAVREALQSLESDELKILLAYFYHNKLAQDIANKYKMTIRTFFRKISQIVDKFLKAYEKSKKEQERGN